MSDCLFCKIVAGEIPSEKVYEDEQAIAFKDISPQAPHHYLIIPRTHVADLNSTLAAEEGGDPTTTLLRVAANIAKQQGISELGYRVVINNGAKAGQEVFHLHLHLLSGRPFSWPPG